MKIMAHLVPESNLNLLLGDLAEGFCCKWPDMLQTAPALIMRVQVATLQTPPNDFRIDVGHRFLHDKALSDGYW